MKLIDRVNKLCKKANIVDRNTYIFGKCNIQTIDFQAFGKIHFNELRIEQAYVYFMANGFCVAQFQKSMEI